MIEPEGMEVETGGCSISFHLNFGVSLSFVMVNTSILTPNTVSHHHGYRTWSVVSIRVFTAGKPAIGRSRYCKQSRDE